MGTADPSPQAIRRDSAWLALKRGLHRLCPQCGAASIFDGWYTLRGRCPVCSLDLRKHEADGYAFMYISTGFFTGVFLIVMLLITPKNLYLGQLLVGVSALLLMGLTLPFRKGLAIALNYWIELRFNNFEGLEMRPEPPRGS
jgi:uncharacterized protein (DUF983 family)